MTRLNWVKIADFNFIYFDKIIDLIFLVKIVPDIHRSTIYLVAFLSYIRAMVNIKNCVQYLSQLNCV